MSIKITWLGHSSFDIEAKGYSIIFDPYEPDAIPGLEWQQQSANKVICSHDHHDHNYAAGVTIKDEAAANPFIITVLNGKHDDKGGTLRGDNKMHILEAEGLKIAHLGDIGCIPDKDQIEQLNNLDALLIPVGGFFTIDAKGAKKLIEMIHPKVVIPMHYRTKEFGFEVIGTLDEFTKLCDNVEKYNSNTFTLTKETKQQTVILKI